MRQARIVTLAEQKRINSYLNTRRHALRDQTIFAVSFNAGLRAMEIAALKISDVYTDTGSVRDVIKLTTTKGGYARRVFVNKRLHTALQRYSDNINTDVAHSPLFPSQKGGHFSGNTMCQLFLEVYAACAMDGASSHSGRRTMITRLADQGISVHVLAAIAGHRNIATTQRYLTVNDAMIARAVELL